MADESKSIEQEKKRKRSFKPKGILSRNKRSSKTNLSKDDDEDSRSFDENTRLNNENLISASKLPRMNKSSTIRKSNEKIDNYKEPTNYDNYKRHYDGDNELKTSDKNRPVRKHSGNQPEYSVDNSNRNTRDSPSGDSKPDLGSRINSSTNIVPLKNRQRPETEPGSSSTIHYDKNKHSVDQKHSNSALTEGKQQKPTKNTTQQPPQATSSSSTNIDDSGAKARLVGVKKIEEANIDVTGEKARLVGVRRLDTPEPRRKHEQSADSDGSSNLSDNEAPDVFLPKRYILAIMMFLGFVNMYAIRVNLNVAIGAMVNNHTEIKGGIAITVAPEFSWSSRLQGIVLGSFYYGYMVLQIPGGYFAMRYGGTKIFGGAIFIASLLTLLTPLATRYSVWGLVFLRVLEGLALGVMLPCNHQIWSLWAPLPERTTLVTIAIAGMNVGTVVTMPLTGLLTKYGFDGGWASVFYCFGLFGIAWSILWVLVVHNSPNSHPSISKKERNYINRNVVLRKSMTVPWKAILTSRPVWAVVAGNIANDWGLYTILICLPLFLMDIMKFNVQTMGFIASLPFLLKAIVGPVGGVIADVLRYKYTTTANVRRIFYAVGAMGAAVLIVIAGYSTTPTMAILSMCVGVALSGLLHSGYEVNILDIAPGLSGIVMGISNTLGTTTGFLSPLLVGVMTENKKRSEWITVFWITFFIYLIGTILFCLLLSGEAQHWAVDVDDDENEEYARDRIP